MSCLGIDVSSTVQGSELEHITVEGIEATDVLISLERRHVKDGDDGVDPFLDGMRANGFARTSYPAAMPVEVFRFRREA